MEISSTKKMSIVIFSCDAYSDLWEDFFRFMGIYWKDKSYKCYLINNRKYFEAKGVKVINAGDGDWSTRARIALEQIETQYVMTFLEDYFLCEMIDNVKFEEALSYIESEKIDYCKLEITRVKKYSEWTNYKDKKYLHNIPKTLYYGIDTAISIWNKDFLLELLGTEDYSAWKFELDRNEDAKHTEKYINKICVIDSRRLVTMCPMVIQGKYFPRSIKLMKKKGYRINTANRKVMSFKEVFQSEIKIFFFNFPLGKKFLKSIGRKLGYTFMSDLYNSKN